MTERTCGNCRWWVKGNDEVFGNCQKRAPSGSGWASLYYKNFCGEWADATITPEQEERRELVRRFAVAIVASGVSMGQAAWDMAEQLADAEPGQI